jgi:hypothetical protein
MNYEHARVIEIFYGVVQALMVLGISGVIKMAFDQKKMRQDLNAAWQKIRQLEKGMKND